MALTISKDRPAMLVADKTYFLNADKSKAVDEDSEEAAFLLVREGCEISPDEAVKYGLPVGPKAEVVSDISTGYAKADLSKMKKAELVVIAESVGVTVVPDSMTNKAIIEKILKAQGGENAS